MLSNADVDCYHTGQPPLHIAIEVFEYLLIVIHVAVFVCLYLWLSG